MSDETVRWTVPPSPGVKPRRPHASRIELMREVAAQPDTWACILRYDSARTAASAASRLRRYDWNEILNLRAGRWEFVSRATEQGGAVWARRSRKPR